MAGHDAPPTHLRVDEASTYVVEWVREVRPAVVTDRAPTGWLVTVLEAYSEEADETLSVSLVVAPLADAPTQPDWTLMHRAPEPVTSDELDRNVIRCPDSPSRLSTPSVQRPVQLSMLERPGMPKWRRAECLACGRPVVRVRDAHNLIGGTLTGSWFIVWPTGPEHMAVTGPIPVDEDIYLLGACHRECVQAAQDLVRDGHVRIERPLMKLEFEDIQDGEYNLHLPADEATCPFCNATESLTDEHIWPRWLSKELRSVGRTLAPRSGSKQPRTSIDFTVPICRPCNNEWLSTLENDVAPILRPMLRGHFVDLKVEQQALLATWATKTAFLIDRISRAVVPRGFPMELAILRRPLPSVAVFLSAYSGRRAAYASCQALHIACRDGIRPDEPTAFVVTFTAHKVAFQVVGHFTKGNMRLNDGRAGLRPALLQLWPNLCSELQWPPPVILPDEGLDALAASLTS